MNLILHCFEQVQKNTAKIFRKLGRMLSKRLAHSYQKEPDPQKISKLSDYFLSILRGPAHSK
jgi:hypothetical protein